MNVVGEFDQIISVSLSRLGENNDSKIYVKKCSIEESA